jgi:hypothetical protein
LYPSTFPQKKNVPINFQRNFTSIEKSQEQESFLLAQKYYLLKMQEKYYTPFGCTESGHGIRIREE